MSHTIKAVLVLTVAGVCFAYATARAEPPRAATTQAADDHAGHDHDAHAGQKKAEQPAAPATQAADEHAGHNHDEHAGQKQDAHKDGQKQLAAKEIAGYTVKVLQESAVKAGKEAAFAIVLTGKKEKPKAVRAWVGVQSAEGSAKGKAVAEGEEWHAHVETPSPIPAKSQFWVEIETSAGKKKVAFDYK